MKKNINIFKNGKYYNLVFEINSEYLTELLENLKKRSTYFKVETITLSSKLINKNNIIKTLQPNEELIEYNTYNDRISKINKKNYIGICDYYYFENVSDVVIKKNCNSYFYLIIKNIFNNEVIDLFKLHQYLSNMSDTNNFDKMVTNKMIYDFFSNLIYKIKINNITEVDNLGLDDQGISYINSCCLYETDVACNKSISDIHNMKLKKSYHII